MCLLYTQKKKTNKCTPNILSEHHALPGEKNSKAFVYERKSATFNMHLMDVEIL